MKGRKVCPLAGRIKKLMQADEDVGKIAQATPVLLARAMEVFLQRLCEKTASVAAARQAKTITTSHLKQCVSMEETLDFLKEIVASAPDLPSEDAVKPSKRRRAAVDVSGADNGDGGSGKKPRARAKTTKADAADAEDGNETGEGEKAEKQQQKKPRAPRRKSLVASDGDAGAALHDHSAVAAASEDTPMSPPPVRRGRASKSAALSVIQTVAQEEEDSGDGEAGARAPADADDDEQPQLRKRSRQQSRVAPHAPQSETDVVGGAQPTNLTLDPSALNPDPGGVDFSAVVDSIMRSAGDAAAMSISVSGNEAAVAGVCGNSLNNSLENVKVEALPAVHNVAAAPEPIQSISGTQAPLTLPAKAQKVTGSLRSSLLSSTRKSTCKHAAPAPAPVCPAATDAREAAASVSQVQIVATGAAAVEPGQSCGLTETQENDVKVEDEKQTTLVVPITHNIAPMPPAQLPVQVPVPSLHLKLNLSHLTAANTDYDDDYDT